MATNVWATTTPAVVNGSGSRTTGRGTGRRSPRRPRAKNSATPADHRRQHHRQRAQGPHRRRDRGSDPGEQPGQRARRTRSDSAVAHSEQLIDRRSAGRTSGVAEDRPASAPRRPPQQAEERQREERDGDDGQHERRARAVARPRRSAVGRTARVALVATVAGSRTSARIAWPCALSTKSMNAARRGRRWSTPCTVTIGYCGDDVDVAGISTPSALSPAALTSVAYTIPASASPAVTLVTTPLTFCSS